MTTILIILLAVFIIILTLGTLMALIYNRLVNLKNHFENAFPKIDVQLRQRYDLTPNFLNTANSYLAYETQALKAVALARARATSAPR